MINDLIWRQQDKLTIRCRQIPIMASAWHNYIDPKIYGLPGWILAYKAILHEAVASFHRTIILQPFENRILRHEFGERVMCKAPRKNALLWNSSIQKVCFHIFGLDLEIDMRSQRLYCKPPRGIERVVQQLVELDAHNLQLFLKGTIFCPGTIKRSISWNPPSILLRELNGRCRAVVLDLGYTGLHETSTERAKEEICDLAMQVTSDFAESIFGTNCPKERMTMASKKIGSGTYYSVKLRRED